MYIYICIYVPSKVLVHVLLQVLGTRPTTIRDGRRPKKCNFLAHPLWHPPRSMLTEQETGSAISPSRLVVAPTLISGERGFEQNFPSAALWSCNIIRHTCADHVHKQTPRCAQHGNWERQSKRKSCIFLSAYGPLLLVLPSRNGVCVTDIHQRSAVKRALEDRD